MRLPSLFVSHGAGPLPVLGEATNAALAASLSALPARLPAPPRAVVLCSAHFEERGPTVIGQPPQQLLYDYGGFPPESYKLQYRPPGAPDVARSVMQLLRGAGFDPQAAPASRGLDHGAFVPLMLMWPGAEVPVVELSILASHDMEAHARMGEALRPLRDEGVLIVGSGSSFHSIPDIFRGMRAPPGGAPIGLDFDDWLVDACTARKGADRTARLAAWASAPGGRGAHPEPDHFVPLVVAAAAGGEDAGRAVRSHMGAVVMSHFIFG